MKVCVCVFKKSLNPPEIIEPENILTLNTMQRDRFR